MRRVTKLILLLALTIISCNRKELSSRDYIAYYGSAENATIKSVKSGSVEYEFRMLPPEYFVMKEMSGEKWSEAGFYTRLKAIEGNKYFLIKIKDNDYLQGMQNPGYKAAVINYYQNVAINNLRLITGSGKKLSPSFVHYEDNYGLSPENNLLVCFYLENGVVDDLTLVYDDELYRNSNVKVSYSKDILNGMPTLKF